MNFRLNGNNGNNFFLIIDRVVNGSIQQIKGLGWIPRLRIVKRNCTVIAQGLPMHVGVASFQFLLFRQVSLLFPTKV